MKDWNDGSVRTVKGGAWSHTTVLKMLRSPGIAGIRVHHGEQYEADWEPILIVKSGSRFRQHSETRYGARCSRPVVSVVATHYGACSSAGSAVTNSTVSSETVLGATSAEGMVGAAAGIS